MNAGYPVTLRSAIADLVSYRFDARHTMVGQLIDRRTDVELASMLAVPPGALQYRSMAHWWDRLPAEIRDVGVEFRRLQLDAIDGRSTHVHPWQGGPIELQQRIVASTAGAVGSGSVDVDIAVTNAFLASASWLVLMRPQLQGSFAVVEDPSLAFWGGAPIERVHGLGSRRRFQRLADYYWSVADTVTRSDEIVADRRAEVLDDAVLTMWNLDHVVARTEMLR